MCIRDRDNELRYKLLLTRRDKDTYINLLKGIPRSEGMSQRIIENYDFFKSKINKENVVAIYSGVQRLFVVDVALEKEKDNPQLIFESMNSTGLDLSQADLIRNYVLMGQEVRLQTSLYESYWYPMEQGYGSEYAALFNSCLLYTSSCRKVGESLPPRRRLTLKAGDISLFLPIAKETISVCIRINSRCE